MKISDSGQTRADDERTRAWDEETTIDDGRTRIFGDERPGILENEKRKSKFENQNLKTENRGAYPNERDANFK